MNQKYRHKLLALLLFFSVSIAVSLAQEPPHPPSTGHGAKGNQNPTGSSRIGGGASILVAFALAYGYRKFSTRKKSEQIATENE